MKKKYPIVMQEDYKDCGVACLSMIIEYYNGHVPYEELKDKLNVSQNGISASSMIEVAKTCGFEAKGIEGDFDHFDETIMLPCIAHLLLEESYYHYVVVFEMNVKKKYLIIGDPAKGIYKMSFQEFEKVWNHIILIFCPQTPIVYIESNHILKDGLLFLIKEEKKPFLIMIFLSIMITIFSILYSFMLQHFISLLDHHNEYAYLYFSILLFASFIFLKNGNSFFRNKLFFHIYQRIDLEFMKKIFDQILNLPYRYYKNRTTGEMIARIEDIGIIRSFLASITLTSLMDFPLFIGSSFFLYFIHSKLFWIALFIMMFYILIFLIYQKRISKKVEKLEEDGAKVTSYMVEVIGGYESIFGSHLKENVQNEFQKRYMKYNIDTKKLEMLENQYQIWNQSLFDFALLFILAFGIWLVAKEELSVASLLLFHSLFLYFIEPIRNFMHLGEDFKKVKVSWRRLSNMIQNKEELGIYEKKIKGNITFQNVNFSYFENHPILKNMSFQIKAGSKVLMIGESGNGKSTILKLLMKYYEVSRNCIYLDDMDILDYKEEAINQNMIYVSMKEQLFTGPLYQNILLGKKPDEHYREILKLTEVEDIISKNVLGHHLVLEENGANLSGGEKQRVVLARTLLLPFEILLLDEATSQIDINMERRILKKLFQKYPDKTIVMVAHRTDNIDLFDQMIEIKEGTIRKDETKNGRTNLSR